MTAQNEPTISSEKVSLPLTFPPHRRLRSGLDFKRVYELRQKVSDSRLLIFGARNELGSTRIGLSISRRNGNSVVRHRLRRLIREAYRLEQHHIPEGLDLILIPNRGAKFSTQLEFRESLVALTKRLAARIGTNPESKPETFENRGTSATPG